MTRLNAARAQLAFGLACALPVVALVMGVPTPARALQFTAGDLVLSIYGNGDGSGTYLDNGASPITLQQVTTAGTTAGQLVLPQTQTTVNGTTNYAISGELGSSSEGTLSLSGNGQFLTIAGYGVNAQTFNGNAQSFGGATKSCINQGTCYPLAQTSSVPGFAGSAGSGVATAVTVPRVVALIGANGSVDTSTGLTGVYNENNPRSVVTVNGTSFYLSGQGYNKSDTTTQGVFYTPLGSLTATKIDSSFDTRTISIQNGQLYVSSDSTEGSGVHENISSYGTAGGTLPTSASSATVLPNLKSKYLTTSAAQLNSIDAALGGSSIYLSPENYFFANATTLYVADSGAPKGDNNGTGAAAQGLGDGGLQKFTFANGIWTLQYTISSGLNLVPDTTTCSANQIGCGTTGLYGLTGTVTGNTVQLYATSYTLGDLDQSYLFGTSDLLSGTTATNPGDIFTTLYTAAPDTQIRGVAFAPTAAAVPEPNAIVVMLTALVGLAAVRRRRNQG